jgi:hypothetical protein
MSFLIDHNLEGQAVILYGNIANQGWLTMLPIRFVTFEELGISVSSDDRIVWRCAQENQMILLTANRTMKGKDSLEEVIREENAIDSFPVITIGNLDRIEERDYRNRCADRIVEIVLDIQNYMGVGGYLSRERSRLFGDRSHLNYLLSKGDRFVSRNRQRSIFLQFRQFESQNYILFGNSRRHQLVSNTIFCAVVLYPKLVIDNFNVD